MKIAVFGWYGTETIGDRGILLGLLKAFGAAYGPVSVRLGTFYPFYTERTLSEDTDLAARMTGREPDVTLFHSRSPLEIIRAVHWSDLVVIGGGPMMHFDPLHMFAFAIRLARRMGRKTALACCGVGPLNGNSMRRSFVRMAEACDLVLLRDAASAATCDELFREAGKPPPRNLHVTCDPAVFCTMGYCGTGEGGYTAVNLRDFPEPYSAGASGRVNGWLERLVRDLAERLGRIVLVPMNHFHVGTDDRVFLHRVAAASGAEITDRVLTLEETMGVFADADLCVGMRFHSVLFQTLLNGNNYVLDYTDPARGKIVGFLNEVGGREFYLDRYVALQCSGQPELTVAHGGDRFAPAPGWREDRFDALVGHLKGLAG